MRVSDLLRQRKAEIIASWERAVSRMAQHRRLSGSALRDHMPALLDRIAEAAEAEEIGESPPYPAVEAECHAVQRTAEGYAPDEIVVEYAKLRACVEHALGSDIAPADLRVAQRLIDDAIVEAVVHATSAQQKALACVDALLSVVQSSETLPVLLEKLTELMVDAVPPGDAGAIFLREGQDLRLSACFGLSAEARGATVTIGSGFAGRVAAERRPMQIRGEETRLASDAIRREGLVELYGVPLCAEGDVVGVAVLGSRGGSELSGEDKLTLRALADRAAIAITQQILRDRARVARADADRSHADLARSEARFRATFDIAPVGIADVTLDGRWLRMNPHFCEILGYADAELLGRRYEDFTHPDDLEASRANAARVASGRASTATLQKRYIRRDGSPVWVQLTLALARGPNGEPDHFVTVAEDVTQRRRMTAALQDAVERRDDILAIVSHDLKNPLSTIALAEAAFLRSAASGTSSDTARTHAQRVLRSTEHMHRIIDDLLDDASIQAGRLTVEASVQSADALVDEAVDAHAPVAHERGIDLQSAGASGAHVLADRNRVLQVLSNLVGNALKFTPPHGHVHVSVAPRDDEVVLCVADDGPGLDAEELAHVFDRYWQRSRRRNRGAGVGLGLAIARGIVETHGGRMWAESTPGKGSTFCFTLPRAPAP